VPNLPWSQGEQHTYITPLGVFTTYLPASVMEALTTYQLTSLPEVPNDVPIYLIRGV